MSELKAYRIKGVTLGDTHDVYLKSEADEVIAELEMKLALAQQVLRYNKPEALYSNLETMSRLTHEKYVVERRERHQKYKRCLAMAERCAEACNREFGLNPEEMTDKEFYKQQIEFWPRWERRWLELAKKFKEAK